MHRGVPRRGGLAVVLDVAQAGVEAEVPGGVLAGERPQFSDLGRQAPLRPPSGGEALALEVRGDR